MNTPRSRSVEIAPGLVLSTIAFKRLHRDQQERLECRLHGKDAEWTALLDGIEKYILGKLEAEDVRSAYLVRRRIEKIVERLQTLSLHTHSTERAQK